MICFKCGQLVKMSKCVHCGSDFSCTPVLTIWPIDEEGFSISAVSSIKKNGIKCAKNENDPKLDDIEHEEIFFETGLYRGQIKNGKRNGYGIQYDKDGRVIYAGYWLNDKKSGHGKIYNRYGGCEFEGYFYEGLRHGKGIEYLPTYKESMWENGVRIIKPINKIKKDDIDQSRICPPPLKKEEIKVEKKIKQNHNWDGSVLSTKDRDLLSNTKRERILLPCGEYVGDSKNGMRDGFGIQYDQKKNITYAGMWKNDKKHGKGRIYNQCGMCQFEGYFINGLRDGDGIDYMENGKTVPSKWLAGVRITKD